jgi:cytochrome c biogenesis protein CcmG/thiol:disulfide interchange protein DsbE
MTKPDRKIKTIAITLLAVALGLGMYVILQRRSPSSRRTLVRDSAMYAIAPDFSLTSLSGQPVRLSDFHGKVILLDYWATWCAPCRIETPKLIELQKRYGAQGLQVIGISMDDEVEPVKSFAQELRINYPVALGDVKVAEAYGGVLGLPVVFLIDRQGRIYRKLAGDAEMQSVEAEVRILLQEP